MSDLRPSLLVGGHDPATAAGQIAFLALDNLWRAEYLYRIQYLEHDVARLLGLLDHADRAEVEDLLGPFGDLEHRLALAERRPAVA